MKKGVKPPKMIKTGTTIVGIVFDGGVIIGADTRSTAGTIVANKNAAKVHYIAPNIYCAGAGTAADTRAVVCLNNHATRFVLFRKALRRIFTLSTKERPPFSLIF